MPSLTSMAEAALAQAKKIDAYLERHHIPYPSFDLDTLDQLPDELQNDRWALANSSNDLKKLARGGLMSTMDTALSWTDALSLRVVYHYKLANAVPLDGTASYSEIAAASGLRESLCRRFIRTAIGNNIFNEEPETQRVRHTAISRLLATNQGLCDGIGLQLDEVGPASSKLLAVWDKYGQDASEPNQSAFSWYNNTEKTLFEVVGADPARGRRFGGAMHFYTEGDSWNVRHLLKAFDWPSIDKPGNVVVDVGGGNGQVSEYLARHTSNAHFIVQDLPHTIPGAIEQLPTELKPRIDFVVHDFFKPQSIEKPPAMFLLRYVLHDWSDKYAIVILQNLIPALNKDSVVLIFEYVLEDGPVHDLTARFGFQMDGIMATFFNSLERNAVEYKQLTEAADKRFVVRAVRRPSGSTMSVIEVGWLG